MSVILTPTVPYVPEPPPAAAAPDPGLDFGSGASVLAIINQALIMLQTAPAQSLDETNPHTVAATALWDAVRDETLTAHAWSFATFQTALARTADAPAFGYAYGYELPTGCLRVLQISSQRLETLRASWPGLSDAAVAQWLAPPLVWQISGSRILTNETDLYLAGIERVTDPCRYDPLFVNCLAANLALKLSYSLAGSSSHQQVMTSLYADYLRQARSIDGSQQEGLRSWGEPEALLLCRSGYGY